MVTGKHEGDRSPATHYPLHHNELTPGGRSARKTGQFYVDKKKNKVRNSLASLYAFAKIKFAFANYFFAKANL